MHVRCQFCRITRRKAFAMMERFETNGCVYGFHIYQDHWIPVIVERLECRRECAITLVTLLFASSMGHANSAKVHCFT